MPSDDLAASLNTALDGWNRALGLRFVRATAEEVVAELTIGPEHRQPHGVVHGGVYSSMVETVASIGASLAASARNQTVVGLENHTSFLRAVREGTLSATSRPLVRGRRSQVWEASIVTDAGTIAARGTVRLLCLDEGAMLAGKKAALE